MKKLEIAVKIEWTKPIPGMAISPIEIVQPVTLQPHGLKDAAHISATEEIPNILAAIVVPTPASAAPTESKPPQPLSMAFVKQPIPSITPIEIPHETPPPMFVTKPEGQKPPEDPECRPEARPFGGGNGSEANPYKICAAEQLQNIQMALNSAFELSSDINVTGFAFRPIGEKRGPFVGTLNGRQHAIRNLTLVDSIGSEPLGLFSRIGGGARIQNLSLVDASVSNQNALAKNRCMGIVAGSVEGAATLDHVQANGRLSSGAGESVIAGGIVGCAQDVSLKNCGFIGEFDHFTIKAPSIAAGAIGAVGGKSLLSTLNVRIESIDAREKSKLKVAGLIGEVRSPTVEVRRAIVRNATHHAVAGFGSCAGIDGKRFSDIYVEFTTDESVKASPACAGEVRLYSCPDSQHLKPKANCEGPLYRWKDEFKLPTYCPEKACWPSSSQ